MKFTIEKHDDYDLIDWEQTCCDKIGMVLSTDSKGVELILGFASCPFCHEAIEKEEKK